MSNVLDDAVPALGEAEGERLFGRIAWRLLPFMCLMYLLAYLDRVNVGFASLQMSADLGFTDVMFGFGAGIFFVGYCIFEVPSNLILHRVGARRWIARIMISWGVLAIALMFVRGEWSFYGARFLLGAAEAGFFPGMLLYLSYWFPLRHRARMNSLFYMSSALAGMLGGPLSGAILEMDGMGGLRGWQWLFLLEGLPSVLVGGMVFFYLTDRPATARWLKPAEARWVEDEVAKDSETDAGGAQSHGRFIDALKDRRLWLLILVYFALNMGGYGATYWIPKVLKEVTHLRDGQVGLLSAIPFGLAVVAMNLVARNSDRVGDRRWHAGGSLAVAAIGLAWTPFCTSTFTALAALSLAMIGISSAVGPFWAIPGAFLKGTAAAGGIAAINSLGNLGGFLGPYLVGFIRSRYEGFNGGLVVIGGCVLVGAAVLIFAVGDGGRTRSAGGATGAS